MSSAPLGVTRLFGLAGLVGAADAGSIGLYPTAQEPTLAGAQDNAARLQSALATNRVVAFTRPGDYYIGARVTLPATFRHLYLAPGVRLIRHSGFYGNTTTRHVMLQFAEATRSEGVRIDGGGTIGRAYNAGDGYHTIRLVNADRVEIENITFETDIGATGTNYSGKFCALFNRLGSGLFRGLRFMGNRTIGGGTGSTIATASDGLHFFGKADNITIDNVVGDWGDNAVAFIMGDYADYEDGELVTGAASNLNVRGVAAVAGSRGELVRFAGRPALVAAFAAGGLAWNESTRVLSATNAFSTYTHTSGKLVYVSAGTNTLAGWYVVDRKIDANSVRLRRSCQSQAGAASAITITHTGAGGYRNIRIDGIEQPAAVGAPDEGHVLGFMEDRNGGHTALGNPQNELAGVPIEQVVVSNVEAAAPAGYAVVHVSSRHTMDLTLRNVRKHPGAAAGSNLLMVASSAGLPNQHHLRSLTLDGCADPSAGLNSALVYLQGSVDQVRVLNSSFNAIDSASMVSIAGPTNYPATIGDLDLSGSRCANPNAQTVCVVRASNGRVVRGRGSGVETAGVTYFAWCDSTPTRRSRFRLHEPAIIELADFAHEGGNNFELARGSVDIDVVGYVRNVSSIGLLTANAAENPCVRINNQVRTFVLTHADFAAATTSPSANLSALARYGAPGYLPRGAFVKRVRVYTLTTFTASGTLSSMTVDVGNATTADKYVAAAGDAKAAASLTETTVAIGSQLQSFAADSSLVVRLNLAGGAQGNQLTAGRLLVEVEYDVVQA